MEKIHISDVSAFPIFHSVNMALIVDSSMFVIFGLDPTLDFKMNVHNQDVLNQFIGVISGSYSPKNLISNPQHITSSTISVIL